MRRTHIEVRGASTHNLRGVDADIPLGKITVVTGVSGSGKSSLAIDTLYAEGQRRFIESLSAYARQFLDRLERPDFERIDFIPPAIAIGQSSRPSSARASVGSISGLSDLLQLLFGAAATPSCPNGHGPVTAQPPAAVRAELAGKRRGARAIFVAKVRSDQKSRASLIREGYHRVLGPSGEIESMESDRARDEPELSVVVDRLVVQDEPRIGEAIAEAFRLGAGRAEIRFPDSGEVLRLRETRACSTCGFVAPMREARLFNPQSPLGACPECEGFGRAPMIDPDKVVPDPSRSLLQDAIAPWATPGHAEWKEGYQRLARRHGVDLKKPWQALSDQHRALIFEGDPVTGFAGVRGFFTHLERKRYKISARILIARYRGYVPCPRCGGQRLTPGPLAFQIAGRSIAEVHRCSIGELRDWIAQVELDLAVEPLRERLSRRLELLAEIGLTYLSLDREGRTLSAGEARRVHLASALGAGVTGTLYVLDEPSIGLHARDTERLARLLRSLADSGNTVVVVEHDTELMLAADHLIELGPDAGHQGGRIVFAGSARALAAQDTKTGRALSGKLALPDLPRNTAFKGAAIRIRGARARTLKDLDLALPLGALTCITGVSGSGKSTLLHEVLAACLPRAIAGAAIDPARARGIEGVDRLGAVRVIDTSPLARSSRSIPATYLDAWSPIRTVLAQGAEAKRLALDASSFSFNSSGGRCPACEGLGMTTVDMQFLADVSVICDQCQGKRFSERTLAARWNGRTVADVLALTTDQAHELFAAYPAIRRRLQPLRDVGLGYLQLGQATSTLSGGEAQRLKLAAHLADRSRGHDVVLLDEPTSGLHHADVIQLLQAFGALLKSGSTLVIVEHHLELIRHAHHVIDLGPEGGEDGGRLVVQGTASDLLESPESRTGAALRGYLAGHAERRIAREA